MSVLFNGGIGQSGVDTGDIGHSLRFRSAYLSRTPSVTGNRQKWIASLPVKRGALGTAQTLIGAIGSSRVTYIQFNANNKLVIYSATSAGGGDGGEYISTRLFRDPGAFLFITIAYDSTQATAGNRIKVWVGQDQITAWDTSTAPTLNHDTQFNWTGATMQIGAYNTSQFLDGYLARPSLVDGGSGDNTTFGYFNTEINEWVSKTQAQVKAVVDAGGTNSFMLDFDDATSLTTLGYDKSSKGNNWTCNNISLTAGTTYDHMLDVPGNSYATLNPLQKGTSITLSAANLTGSIGAVSDNSLGSSTALTTGKWYWEIEMGTVGSGYPCFGVADPYLDYIVGTGSACIRSSSRGWFKTTDGYKYTAGGSTVYGSSFVTGDKMCFAYDADSGKLWFGKNGAWDASGDPVAGTNPSFSSVTAPVEPAGFVTNSSWHNNFGQRPFAFSPPTGFLALCQENLP